jgi:transketolase
MNSRLTPDLDARSRELRRMVVDIIVAGGRGHLGSALSLVEILRVLYDDVLRFRASEPAWPGRDRLILSKGHGCVALYAILAEKGFFPVEHLKTFCRHDSILGGHPEFGIVPGVEASTGALGHGISIGVGMALAARLKGEDWRTYVIVGDGEINEGSVWEAAMAASKHKLGSLTVMVDYNKMQSYGPTSVVQDLEPMADKWRAFGFSVSEVDGHDVGALRRTLASSAPERARPTCIICHTVKGKGIPPAEQNANWHHKNRLSEDEMRVIEQALANA